MSITATDTQQTLLIVDDEAINLQLLCTQFQGIYRVLVAKSGQQALQRLGEEDVDLILLDICMKDMDGYEVLRCIKNTPKIQGIPVIFITAKTQSCEEMMGLQLGAVDYIGKPLQLPIVEARVRTHMELKRKSELLEKLVSIDSLTEIYNRRYFDNRLEEELRRSQRAHQSLSLLMIDIDYFKLFNDSAGHSAGDYCLQQVALHLRNVCQRTSDTLCRYGGEEFSVVAPDTDRSGAEHLARNCVEAIREANIAHPNSPLGSNVTISVGAVSWDNTSSSVTSMMTPREIISAADRCLYQVKESSRNNWSQCQIGD